ncbi:MAG: zinc ribbon domain-containing protein [Gemmatimonadales bacterium]
MTELERFAAAVLAQWRAEGRSGGGPIAVSALLTKVFPYRMARRTLGIDVSEDYEALVLRLLAEDENLARVEPVDAADMAKATITSRLPDLDVLQLLRAATVTITPQAMARLDGVLPMPAPKDEPPDEASAPTTDPGEDAKVIPLRVDREPTHAATPSRPAEPVVPEGPPPAFLTTVSFTPPAEARCWSCTESLPTDRPAKFCPYCGADQQQRTCPACGAKA